jgi:nicotinamidase-related amidase
VTSFPAKAAFIIIDVQYAIDDPSWASEGPRNNPGAETNVARLLAAWRQSGRPVIHIRHDSTFPQSAYRPEQRGNDFKDEVRPERGETVMAKRANSAFIGTALERHLHDAGIGTLLFAGVITNNSVEATVRMAGNLGFATYLVEDACFTFARRDFRGRLRSADEVHAMSLANLAGEYCTVITTAQALDRIG